MARDIELKREYDRAYREKHREELNAKAKARMAAYYKTDKYKAWLIKSRDYRVALKEKYRRKNGSKTRAEISAAHAARVNERSEYLVCKDEFKRLFVGPPRPSAVLLGVAGYQRWTYRNIARVRQYQIRKRHKNVVEVPLFYAREQLHLKNSSIELVQLNQAKLIIKRLTKNLTETIKEKSNEHQRGY